MGAPDEPVVVPVDDAASGADDADLVAFGRPRRARRRSWRWFGACAALALAAGVAVAVSQQDDPQATDSAPATPTTPSASDSSAPATAADLPAAPGGVVDLPASGGKPVDIALGERGLYVLQADGTLRRVGGETGALLGDEAVPGPPRGADRLLVDESAQRSWAIGFGEPTVVQITQGGVAAPPVTHDVRVPAQAFGAALLGGRLWLATGAGVYEVSPGGGAPTLVPGFHGMVYAIAADPARDRLIGVTGSWPSRILQIRHGRAQSVADAALQLGKPSIAVTSHGIWVGGFANGSDPRLVRLDPATLRVDGGSPVQVGPGAIVWPGESVVWVRGGGGPGLSCVDAATGRVLASWGGLDGPVVSRHGLAYGFWYGEVIRLHLPASCPG